MAKYSNNTTIVVGSLTQPYNLVRDCQFGDSFPWSFSITDGSVPPNPLNLTDYVITFYLRRLQLTSLTENRDGGFMFTAMERSTPATAINIPINNVVPASGSFLLKIDTTALGLTLSDPELAIDSAFPAFFAGRLLLKRPDITVGTVLNTVPNITVDMALLINSNVVNVL